MTRGEMVSECALTMGLDTTAGGNELILMQRWFNRGIVDVLLKTHCYVDIGTMTLTSGDTDYRIDSNILAVDNITVPDLLGNAREVDVIDMVDLLPYLANIVVAQDAPWKAAVEGTLLRVAPAPTSAVVLTYYYVPKPSTIAAADGTTADDAADPSTAAYGGIPTEYHDAVLAYMIWKAAQYDQQGGGFFRGHAFAPGSAYGSDYEELCAKYRKAHRRKAGRGLHAGRVGYPDRQHFPRRNDTYPTR
jgi:hypothetical protein